MQRSAPFLWNILGAALFAAMGVLAHAISKTADWRVVVLCRALVGLGMSIALARRAGVTFTWAAPRAVWIRSSAGAGAMLLNFYALGSLPASDVLTLRNTSPIWMALVAGRTLGIPTGPGVWAAVLCGVAGVVLVERPRLEAMDPPTLAALAASFLTATAMLALSRCGAVHRALVVAHFSAVTALAAGAALVVGPGAAALGTLALPEVAGGLAGVGVLGCVAQLCMTHAYGKAPPVSLAVVGLTQVLFALALDLLVGYRVLTGVEALGTFLVVLPTTWLSVRPPPPSYATPQPCYETEKPEAPRGEEERA